MAEGRSVQLVCFLTESDRFEGAGRSRRNRPMVSVPRLVQKGHRLVQGRSFPDHTFPMPPSSSGTTSLILITGERQGGTDRKSTRLNSSHVRISYAVFCLKKKNKY